MKNKQGVKIIEKKNKIGVISEKYNSDKNYQKPILKTKVDNVFSLYDKLKPDGQKGDAITYISEVTNIKRLSIKANWFLVKELPSWLKKDEGKLDLIITYLQKVIKKNNQDENI